MEFLNFCAGDCIVVELRVEKICDDPDASSLSGDGKKIQVLRLVLFWPQ